MDLLHQRIVEMESLFDIHRFNQLVFVFGYVSVNPEQLAFFVEK